MWLELLVVLAIFAAALTVRVYRLHEFPPGLYNDEAANGLDALNVLAGQHPVFFARNTGREPLFIYLQAGMVALLGATPFALRLTAALVGALAVPAAYWMVREAFAGSSLGARRLALWTALFMAFGYWHLSLSRIGFRANLLPLMASITFALFWRAWRPLQGGGRFPWVTVTLTGLALGVTLYTYTASRFIPILMVIVVAAALLQPGQTKSQRWRSIGALAVVAAVSAVVFAPLGLYFAQHPDVFFGRAASISVLSKQFAGDNPITALAQTVYKTAMMFFIMPDINLRHNPAQRPVFDLLLGLWLVAGLVLSIVRWRRLPYLFIVGWFVLLALPAVLTAEGVPHSLRASGMIPAVYVLPVLAMAAAGLWLSRWAKVLRNWLPLPFLLFSAITGVNAYFGAWQNIRDFDAAFLTNYAQLAMDLSKFGEASGVWLVPLSPNYYLTDATFFTTDFLYQGKAGYTTVLVEPAAASKRLAEMVNGRQKAYLLRTENTERFPEAGYILGDPKNLLRFLLDKYGVQVAEHDDSVLGMPYLEYQVPRHATYQVAGAWAPRHDSFDNKVKLTGVDYGRTAGAADDVDVARKEVPAGDPLWVALRWEPQVPIDIDLKTSLMLKDKAGHVVGQSDDLLVGDRYPVERVWSPGETAGTYHIVPTLPAIPPGDYDLTLRVYEDKTLRPYPAVDDQGKSIGAEVRLGGVTVLPPRTPPVVTPQHTLPADTQLAPDLFLLGYDLPAASVAPGGNLPLTLYWRAGAQPAADYQVTVQLRDADGQVAAERTAAPAGGTYSTTLWSAGTTVRDWHDLPVPSTTPNGSYSLVVAVSDGQQTVGELDLGEITVEGRPHLFEAPPVSVPVEATFGQAVRLLGVESALPTAVKPGDAITIPLAWQVEQLAQQPLVRFVHLLGSDGRPVAQQDGVPCEGACAVETWVPDEVFRDTITLTVPPDAGAGTYRLGVGWYDQNTLERLPAADANGEALADQLVLVAGRDRSAAMRGEGRVRATSRLSSLSLTTLQVGGKIVGHTASLHGCKPDPRLEVHPSQSVNCRSVICVARPVWISIRDASSLPVRPS